MDKADEITLMINPKLLEEINRYWQPRFYYRFMVPMVIQEDQLEQFLTLIYFKPCHIKWVSESPTEEQQKEIDKTRKNLEDHIDVWFYHLASKEVDGESNDLSFLGKGKECIRKALKNGSFEKFCNEMHKFACYSEVDIAIYLSEDGVSSANIIA